MASNEEMASNGPRASSVTVGSVLKRTLHVTRTNLGTLLPALAILFLPGLIVGLLALGVSPPAKGQELTVAPIVVGAVQYVLGLALWYLSQGVAIVIAVESLAGGRPSLGDSVRKGFSRVGPLLFAGVLESLGVTFGMLFCLVPGFILMAAWALTIPIVVMEERSAIEAIRRSWELTRGYRGRLFVATLGLGLLAFISSMTLTVLTLGADAFEQNQSLLGPEGNVLNVVANYANSVFWGMILSVIAAVFYIDIKNEKEGVDVAALTSVFE